MMTINRISPVLGVKRVRQSAEYYRDVLGFSLDPIDGVFQPTNDEADGVYAIVKKGNNWIHFQIRRGIETTTVRPALERDIYIMVDDIAEEYSNLVQRGANVIQAIHDTPYGIREFTIEDLNGFRISFGMVI